MAAVGSNFKEFDEILAGISDVVKPAKAKGNAAAKDWGRLNYELIEYGYYAWKNTFELSVV